MGTITIPKTEYQNIIKSQVKLSRRLDLMQKMISEFITDEISPEYVKKLNRISAQMDKGEGIRFSNPKEMKKYLSNL